MTNVPSNILLWFRFQIQHSFSVGYLSSPYVLNVAVLLGHGEGIVGKSIHWRAVTAAITFHQV